MVSPNKDPYDFPASPLKTRDAMTAETPSKEDGLVHREKPDTSKASPALRTGTPRGNTPRGATPRTSSRVGTPKAGTPRGTPKVSTPKTETPAKKSAPVVSDSPAEPAEPAEKSPEKNGDKLNGDEVNGVEVNGDAPNPANPGFKEDVAIDEFVEHRVDPDNSTVDIKVKWEGGETTWESEWSLQEQVPTLVYKYWEKLGGREEATQLDVYHVFKILKCIPAAGRKKSSYQVQWVGYKQNDSTWESEEKLRLIAPGELEKFEAKQLASGASAEKRKTARGPGRPRKKPRYDD
ncbi:hypothetical protein Forpe1208_v003842 [Fusarium oxysporum f. sp. rapae]|uniref:Chromo domain-containing protein n=1 Tax=Fusarium oxysporum f. sp. rapae TaxID=485398 RepID=A0A8J5P6Z9_FUSOX|nr:hypothetical protein Forpe1208_v003842 [Fusarium oxysporum f. sp. rapae]